MPSTAGKAIAINVNDFSLKIGFGLYEGYHQK